MSGLNFSGFKVVDKANTRTGEFHGTPRTQDFSFKYKKSSSKGKDGELIMTSAFELSTKLFAALDLANKDKGLVETIGDGVSYLAIVSNEHAVFLKTTKKNENGIKGKSFKSSILETALAEQGIIDVNQVGVVQKLTLTLAEGSVGVELGTGTGIIAVGGVYSVGKDTSVSAPVVVAPVEPPQSDSPTTNTEVVPVEELAVGIPVDEATETTTETEIAPEVSSTPAAEDDDF